MLLFGASPSTMTPIRAGKELKEIQREVRLVLGTNADNVVHYVPHTVIEDFQSKLDERNPCIVHFSGHGSQGGIFVNDDDEKPIKIRTGSLKRLFSRNGQNVNVVFLNACYTKECAKAITSGTSCVVIGIHGRAPENAAIKFAAKFYSHYFGGKSVKKAFDEGVTIYGMAVGNAKTVPIIEASPGVNPADIYFEKNETQINTGSNHEVCKLEPKKNVIIIADDSQKETALFFQHGFNNSKYVETRFLTPDQVLTEGSSIIDNADCFIALVTHSLLRTKWAIGEKLGVLFEFSKQYPNRCVRVHLERTNKSISLTYIPQFQLIWDSEQEFAECSTAKQEEIRNTVINSVLKVIEREKTSLDVQETDESWIVINENENAIQIHTDKHTLISFPWKIAELTSDQLLSARQSNARNWRSFGWYCSSALLRMRNVYNSLLSIVERKRGFSEFQGNYFDLLRLDVESARLICEKTTQFINNASPTLEGESTGVLTKIEHCLNAICRTITVSESAVGNTKNDSELELCLRLTERICFWFMSAEADANMVQNK